jgi:hypothetical protein
VSDALYAETGIEIDPGAIRGCPAHPGRPVMAGEPIEGQHITSGPPSRLSPGVCVVGTG